MANPKKFLRTEHLERIDQPDFDHAAVTSQVEVQEQLHGGLVVGDDVDTANLGARDAQPVGYILKGFDITTDGTNVTVSGGSAILPYKFKGETRAAQLVTASTASKSINVKSGTYAGATAVHGIFIRFALEDDDISNRLFWDPTASPAGEFAAAIPTREVETWQLSIAPSQSADWLKIGEVTPDTLDPGGTDLVDKRNFFFEGRRDATSLASTGYAIEDADWGGSTDRNAIRSSFGVFGFARFVKAIQRQLQDILGDGINGWWQSLPNTGGATGASLSFLNSNKLDRRGQSANITGHGEILGHIYPDALFPKLYDLGAASREFRDFTGRAANLGAAFLTSIAEQLVARLDMEYGNTQATLLFQSRWFGGNQEATRFRVYRIADAVGAGEEHCLAITINAYWQDAANNWANDTASAADTSLMWTFSHANGLRAYTNTGATTWASGSWTQAWDITRGGTANLSGLLTLDTNTPSAAFGVSNSLYANMIPKAWGKIVLDGAGGYGIVDGVNINTLSGSWGTLTSTNVPNDTIYVPLTTGMANTGYAVLAAFHHDAAVAGFTLMPVINGIGDFDLVARDSTGGTTSAMATALSSLSFIVFGTQ